MSYTTRITMKIVVVQPGVSKGAISDQHASVAQRHRELSDRDVPAFLQGYRQALVHHAHGRRSGSRLRRIPGINRNVPVAVAKVEHMTLPVIGRAAPNAIAEGVSSQNVG
jgi:hypothetical protein